MEIVLNEQAFIRAYRKEVKSWVAEYKKNTDPENWTFLGSSYQFEHEMFDKIEGFEEEKSRIYECVPEVRSMRHAMKQVNRAAETICRAHYNFHEFADSWPLPPAAMDYTPKIPPAGWETKYTPKFFTEEQDGVLIIGQLLLSWKSYNLYGRPRTKYAVSHYNGSGMDNKHFRYNGELPRKKDPLIRHAEAIAVVQEMSKLVDWSLWETLQHKQKRSVVKQFEALRGGLGNVG